MCKTIVKLFFLIKLHATLQQEQQDMLIFFLYHRVYYMLNHYVFFLIKSHPIPQREKKSHSFRTQAVANDRAEYGLA